MVNADPDLDPVLAAAGYLDAPAPAAPAAPPSLLRGQDVTNLAALLDVALDMARQMRLCRLADQIRAARRTLREDARNRLGIAPV